MLYALKSINKLDCISKKSTQNIFRERLILQDIQHPFVVTLHYAFQDEFDLFMVIDAARGGDLRFHMDHYIKCADERVVRVYAAEMASALSYLHELQVVHRDIKPDNVLLDDRGHILITDFNIAVSLTEKTPSSQSGTLSYMAPEMFLGKPYKYHVDWWALGILLYELTYGKRPFRGRDEASVKNAIRTGKIVFHETHQRAGIPIPASPEREAFLTGLLERDITKRIGSNGFEKDVCQHPWMAEIDWPQLLAKNVDVAYVPDISSSNYDTQLELEEMLMDSTRPTQKPRRWNGQAGRRFPFDLAGQTPSSSSLPRTKPVIQRSASLDRVQAEQDKIDRELDFMEAHFLPYSREKGFGRLDRAYIMAAWSGSSVEMFARQKSMDQLVANGHKRRSAGRGRSSAGSPAAPQVPQAQPQPDPHPNKALSKSASTNVVAAAGKLLDMQQNKAPLSRAGSGILKLSRAGSASLAVGGRASLGTVGGSPSTGAHGASTPKRFFAYLRCSKEEGSRGSRNSSAGDSTGSSSTSNLVPRGFHFPWRSNKIVGESKMRHSMSADVLVRDDASRSVVHDNHGQ
ncbi:kinase-like domain-containing protein [Entophlyctis helioformis]|nr:kinase-like domain-containing protein [Entophlyctis helioformis]